MIASRVEARHRAAEPRRPMSEPLEAHVVADRLASLTDHAFDD
jgi:hypothetical protein